MPVKQVIVIRSNLKNKNGDKVRTGKIASQAAHASIKFICDRLERLFDEPNATHRFKPSAWFSKAELEWLTGSFAKVTLQVQTEEELLEIHEAAKKAGLVSSLIVDAGKTEFGGVPTKTPLAIGPDESSKIDKITGHLSLY